MADLSTDAIAALQAVEDWWLSSPGHQRDHGAPACIFMVREVLARYGRTGTGVTVVYGSPVQRPPCTVCGTPYEKHGSYPTCASHPYEDGFRVGIAPPIFVANGGSEGALDA